MTDERSQEGRAPGCRVVVLDCLLRIREDALRGRIAMYLGDVDVDRLRSFVDGYNACLSANGCDNHEYGLFREWLRERGEFPVEGWAVKYLADREGDPQRAIRKYLDFAAEFVAIHRQ
jgi:hypothetical protein